MPKIKVKGLTVQTGEHPKTNGHTHTHTDATKRIISPGTRSINIVNVAQCCSCCYRQELNPSGFEARRKFFEQEIENAQPAQPLVFQRPRRGELIIQYTVIQ